MKNCPRCSKSNSLDEFYKSKQTPDGLDGWCKLCRNASNRERWARKREQYLQQKQIYYQENKEVFSDKNREYYTANAEQVKARVKQYRMANQQKVNERQRQSHFANRAERIAYKRQTYAMQPQQNAARRAVRDEIRAGRMRPAKQLHCNQCNSKAHEYHHWSYEPEHWLDVIALCKSCHQQLHHQMEVQYATSTQ